MKYQSLNKHCGVSKRGNSFVNYAVNCRSISRAYGYGADDYNYFIGFRLINYEIPKFNYQ